MKQLERPKIKFIATRSRREAARVSLPGFASRRHPRRSHVPVPMPRPTIGWQVKRTRRTSSHHAATAKTSGSGKSRTVERRNPACAEKDREHGTFYKRARRIGEEASAAASARAIGCVRAQDRGVRLSNRRRAERAIDRACKAAGLIVRQKSASR